MCLCVCVCVFGHDYELCHVYVHAPFINSPLTLVHGEFVNHQFHEVTEFQLDFVMGVSVISRVEVCSIQQLVNGLLKLGIIYIFVPLGIQFHSTQPGPSLKLGLDIL